MMVLNRANDCICSLAWSEADSLFKNIVTDESFPMDLKADAMASYGRMLTIFPSSDYEKAVSMYERSMELFEDSHLHKVNDECVYAYALAKVGRMKEAKEIFTKLDGQGMSSIPVYRYCLSQVMRLEGDDSGAYTLLLESLKGYDAETMRIQSQSSALAQRNYYRLLSSEREQSMLIQRFWTAIVIFISIIMIVIISILLYKRYLKAERERIKLVLLNEASENRLAESDKSKEKMLKDISVIQTDYLKLYKNQCRWMSEFAEIFCDSKKKDSKSIQSEVYGRIYRIVSGINSNGNIGQLEFESELNRTYNNVMKKFRQDYADLCEADIRLFSCVVAQFDAVLILKIFNLPSKDAVYMRKARLKEKIRQGGSTDKERYLLFF